MKHLFKTFFYLVAITCFLTACSSDSDGDSSDGTPEAKLLSFGFYEKDNEGVILEDYAGSISGTTVSVIMPKDIDKSNLVAYFTLSDGASASTDGIKQVSGTTTNNFSSPIDYIVSNGSINTKYTITITKQADNVWSKVSQLDNQSVSSFKMKVNPVSGEPYILIKKSGTSLAAMVKYSNNTWTYLGSSDGFSAGAIGSYMDLAFDSKGTPYVVYPDNSVTPSGAATVMYFDGSAWKTSGSKITSEQVTYSGIALNANDEPMILNMYNKAIAPFLRRELVVSTYSGSQWTTDQKVPNRIAAKYGYLPNGKLMNETVYWSVFNAGVSPQTYSVYSYKGGVWTTIADDMIESGATNLNLREFRMDVDKKENIYIGVSDNAADGTAYKPRIKKYTQATKQWSNVGSVIDMDIDNSRHFDFAISPINVPFVVYRNDTNYPTVVNIDSETKVWTSPSVLDAIAADEVYIDFNEQTGVGYIVYTDPDKNLILYKYDKAQ